MRKFDSCRGHSRGRGGPRAWNLGPRAKRAAGRLRELGLLAVEAEVRLRLAAALAAAGRRTEAEAELGKALAFFRSVGATRYVRRAEELLAATA